MIFGSSSCQLGVAKAMYEEMYGNRDCSTCKHYLRLVKISMCLRYRCAVCPRENIFCPRWERDNLDDDDAENGGE